MARYSKRIPGPSCSPRSSALPLLTSFLNGAVSLGSLEIDSLPLLFAAAALLFRWIKVDACAVAVLCLLLRHTLRTTRSRFLWIVLVAVVAVGFLLLTGVRDLYGGEDNEAIRFMDSSVGEEIWIQEVEAEKKVDVSKCSSTAT